MRAIPGPNSSRQYNLEAVFSARSTAGPVLNKIKEDIGEIGSALTALGAYTAKPEIDLSGDKETIARTKTTKKALEDFEGTYTAKQEVKRAKEFKNLEKDLNSLHNFAKTWTAEVEFKGMDGGMKELQQWEKQWTSMRNRVSKTRFETPFEDVAKDANYLIKLIDDELFKARELKADFSAMERMAKAAQDTSEDLTDAEKAARKLEKALADAAQRREIRMALDKEQMERDLKGLETGLKRLTSTNWEVMIKDANLQEARTKYRSFSDDLNRMFNTTYRLKTQTDFPEMAKQAQRFEKQFLQPLMERRDSIKIDLDTKAASAKALGFRALMQRIAGTYHIDMEVRGGTAAVASMAAISMAARRISQDFGRLQPIGQAFAQRMYIIQQASFAMSRALMAIGVMAIGPLIAGLTIGIFSLTAFAGGLGLVALAAAPLISALASQQERAEAAEQATTELKTAQSNAASAAQAYAQAQSGVSEAQSALGRAEQDASAAIADSARATEDARRQLTTATQATAAAQQELNVVMRDEPHRLDEAALNLKDARLSEKEAAEGVIDAERELDKARRRGTPSEVRDAELALERARLSMEQSTLNVQNSERDLADMRKHGSDELQAAKEGVVDARAQEEEAARGVADAERSAARTRRDAARSVSDASKAVTEAQKQAKLAAQELKAAEEEVAAAERKRAAALKPLEKGVQNVIDAWGALQTAYGKFFPGANDVFNRMATNAVKLATIAMPTLGATAERTALEMENAFSQVFRDWQSGGVLKSIQRIMRQMPNITGNWIKGLGRFGGALINVFALALPFARRFSQAVARVAGQFLRWTESKEGRQAILNFFTSAYPVAHALWQAIKLIGGAILRWSTSHPHLVADAIRVMAGIIWYAGAAVVWVVQKIHSFATTYPKIATLIGWFGALVVAGYALRGPLLFFLAVARVVFPLVIYGLGAVGAAFGFTGLAAIGMGLVVVAAVAAIIAAVILAYNTWANYLAPTFKGLEMMVQQNKISFIRALWAGMRTWVAGISKFIMQGILLPVDLVLRVLSMLPGALGNSFESARKSMQGSIDAIAGDIRGNLGNAAQEMGQQGKKGANNYLAEIEGIVPKVGPNMRDIKSGITKPLQQANKQGTGHLKEMKDGSAKWTGDMKDITTADMRVLQRNAGISSKKTKEGVTGDMFKMKEGSLGSIGNLKQFGLEDMDLFKTGSSSKSESLKGNVTGDLNETREKGGRAMWDLSRAGRAAMTVAHDEQTDLVWETAVQYQGALNAMLSGMGKFIQNAGIKGVDKPQTFDPITRGGSYSSGNMAPQGSSRRPGSEKREASGDVLKFAQGGQAPIGGVANGTTRVYGEIPGTTEYYITDNPRYRKRNMEILAKANQHLMGEEVRGTKHPHGIRGVGGRHGPDHHAMGGIAKMQSGGIYPVTPDNVLPEVYKTWQEANRRWGVPGTTYGPHGADAWGANSLDMMMPSGWGVDATGAAKQVGDEIVSWLQSAKADITDYIIWYYKANYGQGWETYTGGAGYPAPSNPSSYHTDHVHWEYEEDASQRGFNATGKMGSGTPMGPDYSAMASQYIKMPPKMPNGLGHVTEAANASLKKAYEQILARAIEIAPTSGTGSPLAPSGASPAGLTIGEALSQGGWPSNLLVPASSTVWHESTGNAKAQNASGARGLMQIMPGTAAGVGADYSKLYDPIYNTSTGKKVYDQAGGWGPWVGAGQGGDYRDRPVTGYRRGGIHEPELHMKRGVERAFILVADTLRQMGGDGPGGRVAIGDGGGVGTGRQVVAITNEAGPEAIVPKRRTKRGANALVQANQWYGVPGFATGGVIPQSWNLVGGDGALGIGGPAAKDAIAAGQSVWGNVSIGAGSDVNAVYQQGSSAGSTSSGGLMRVNPAYAGTPMGEKVWGHEIGHALGLAHSNSGIMTPSVNLSSRPSSAEIEAVQKLIAGPVDADRHGGSTPTQSGGGGMTINQTQQGPGPQRSVQKQFNGGGGSTGGGRDFGGSSSYGGESSPQSMNGGGRRQQEDSGGSQDMPEEVKKIFRNMEKHLRNLDDNIGKGKLAKMIGQMVKGGLDHNLKNDPDTIRAAEHGQKYKNMVRNLGGRN